MDSFAELKKLPGCQHVFDSDGNILLRGDWNPKVIFNILTGNDVNFWHGKRVLDIGANTLGLSLEIARNGASVCGTEPDPYENNRTLATDIVLECIKKESLDLTIEDKGLFECRSIGEFDVILCLGLLYHFRYPQLILDHLSSMNPEMIFISTQTHPSDDLALFNRVQRGILAPGFLDKTESVLTGWHPTRALFEKMLMWAGFDDVTSLTTYPYDFPHKAPGTTNSAYYSARLTDRRDPGVEKGIYYPR